MMRYYLCITTAKKMEDFTKYSVHICNCVKKFNTISNDSRNYKNIREPIVINKESLELELESHHELRTPLRALWLFSKLLLEDSQGLGQYVLGTRFLKLISVRQVTSEKTNLSDREILKQIIDIYLDDKNLSPYMNQLNDTVKNKINQLVIDYMYKKE